MFLVMFFGVFRKLLMRRGAWALVPRRLDFEGAKGLEYY